MDEYTVQLGTVALAPVETRSYENGPLVAPTAAPTVVDIWLNSTANAALVTAATIPQLTDGSAVPYVGQYQLNVPTVGLALHDRIQVLLESEVTPGVFRRVTKIFRVIQQAGLDPVLV